MKNKNSIEKMVKDAEQASFKLGLLPVRDRNHALKEMAKALKEEAGYILKQNQKDVKSGQEQGLASALIDRLTLNEKRIKGMIDCLLEVSRLPDPIGHLLEARKRPNGLVIKKVRVPIGVIGIIFESRPNVASDCAGLCLKSGNAVVLKGGKEAVFSNAAILKVLKGALAKTKVPADAIQMVASTDRSAVLELLKQDKYVDMIIPRGGENLIRFVAENSLIPVVKHYKGVCHTYVSAKTDLRMAESICYNAKVQRPGVCNAMETLLVDKKIAVKFLPSMAKKYLEAGVELRGCPATRKILGNDIVKAVQEDDWYAEYLDLILSIRVVNGVDEAVEHINKYGSHHSDAIVTENHKEAESFLRSVDSATVYVNASTRFTDGYEFGMGAEIGISTDKLHARGPMALEELTIYKYLILGNGQIRK
jgi:glutamate-5-semialdehyde dehydrogenase